MARTFKHSGDLGDIIFSLPTIRALGGGILYLDPKGGEGQPLIQQCGTPKTKLSAGSIARLKPLLARVPFIAEVRLWEGEPVEFNLDLFRQHLRFNNVCDSHLAAFGLPITERDRPWIEITDPMVDPRFPIIVARSVRYHSNYPFWAMNMPKIAERCAFVGLPKEHEIFEYTFEVKVHFWDAPDVLSLTRILAGAQQVICNQSLPQTLAEAMKKNLVNEVFRINPGAVFNRPGATYV
jgi:hypothetical protein